MSKASARRRAERKFLKMLELKAELFRMQGGVCFLCERPFSLSKPATIEHLRPRSMGGTNHFDNLALTHAKCNQKRDCHPIMAAITFFSNPTIRKHWKRYIISGYLPRIHRLSSTNSV